MSTRTTYDEVAYPSNPLSQAHPSLLAGLGRLHGVDCPSPKGCRYLEMGCGTGRHLIGLAARYPDSEFLGLDYAALPIETATERAKDLGLKNLRFLEADIRDLPDEVGVDWDFVVAHGVFSWVPEEARISILQAARDRLTPNGLAYISYNAFPGGRIRQIIWDLLRYETERMPDPQDKIHRSREVLSWMVKATEEHHDSYRAILAQEVERSLHHKDEELLFHDDLSPENQPFHIAGFLELARPFGLQYVCEADFHEGNPLAFPPEARDALDALVGDDRVRKEMWMDFARCRRFRQTVLARDTVELAPPSPERFAPLCIVGELKPEGQIDLSPGVKASFKGHQGGSAQMDFAPAKRALLQLSNAAPNAVPVEALLRQTPELTEEERQNALHVLLRITQAGLAHVFAEAESYPRVAGDRPKVFKVARDEAKRGYDLVTNLRHRPIQLTSPLAKWIVGAADGTKDRAQLEHELWEFILANAPEGDRPEREALPRILEEGLEALGSFVLLEA